MAFGTFLPSGLHPNVQPVSFNWDLEKISKFLAQLTWALKDIRKTLTWLGIGRIVIIEGFGSNVRWVCSCEVLDM